MESDQFGGSSTRLYTNSQQPRKSKLKFLIIFIVLALLVGFGITRFLASNQKKAEVVAPTPTEALLPTDTPTPTPEETTTPSPSPSPSTKSTTPTKAASTSTTDKATGIDRSTITVSILNGSGTAGVASKASGILKELGYVIGTTGNADNFDYVGTTIQVKSGKSKTLTLLKKDLESSYTISSTSANLSASSSADAVLIIGK